MNTRRSIVAALALAATVSACGASAPPGQELADEMIETLDVSREVKDCMHEVFDDFVLSEEDAQGFDGLDDVAAKAADGQARAEQIIGELEAELEGCN